MTNRIQQRMGTLLVFVLLTSAQITHAMKNRCEDLLGIIPFGTKVILAANRLPITARFQSGKLVTAPADGGLASALRSTDEKFIWVGWPGYEIADSDKKDLSDFLATNNPRLSLQPVFLSQ